MSTQVKQHSAKQRPVETLRDGQLKAAIWKNEGENGVFYNVTFARTYKGSDGRLFDTHGFSGAQLLRLARLADRAYARVGYHRKQTANNAADENGEGEA